MTQAADLLQAGDPDGALKALTDQVRKAPADATLRMSLMQLLAVQGHWDRARTQLDVATGIDPALFMQGKLFTDALSAEVVRKDVFAGQRTPLIFGEPLEWVAELVEAMRLQSRGAATAATALRDKAFASAPETPGVMDGVPFAWIADADPRLGPMLELVINGSYYWAPFFRISKIKIAAPTDLGDRVWTQAIITWSHGGEVGALIPTRYPGSEKHAESAIRLARMTDWREVGPELYEGDGQRVLATDVGEFAIMDIREITIETPATDG